MTGRGGCIRGHRCPCCPSSGRAGGIVRAESHPNAGATIGAAPAGQGRGTGAGAGPGGRSAPPRTALEPARTRPACPLCADFSGARRSYLRRVRRVRARERVREDASRNR
ncbi:hypothetical protein SSBG_03238 [Streptomyces sp. SPB074]|nr:hypothetical protein SSBG_03238 [Streptomyces sp. SPB074]